MGSLELGGRRKEFGEKKVSETLRRRRKEFGDGVARFSSHERLEIRVVGNC